MLYYMMMNVKVIVFLLSVHHSFGHLSSPENDSLYTTGLIPSTTPGQVPGSLRARFRMVQRIQRLALDVMEVKSNFLDLQRTLIDIKEELHSLETKDQKLEEENAELKQTLKALYTTHQTDELASKDFESLKNETLGLKMKYDKLLLENNAFQNQLNQMKGQIGKIDDLSARLNIVGSSMQNLFLSVNTSLENIREDLNDSCIPRVTGSSEFISGKCIFRSNKPSNIISATDQNISNLR